MKILTIEIEHEGYRNAIKNTMTVGEMIEKLKTYDPALPVVGCYDMGFGAGPIREENIEEDEVEKAQGEE